MRKKNAPKITLVCGQASVSQNASRNTPKDEPSSLLSTRSTESAKLQNNDNFHYRLAEI